MYIHIGSDVAVRECEILGIFDLDGQTASPVTGAFLSREEKAGNLTVADASGLPKSFVYLTDKKKSCRRKKRGSHGRVILSCLSASALSGRAAIGQL